MLSPINSSQNNISFKKMPPKLKPVNVTLPYNALSKLSSVRSAYLEIMNRIKANKEILTKLQEMGNVKISENYIIFSTSDNRLLKVSAPEFESKKLFRFQTVKNNETEQVLTFDNSILVDKITKKDLQYAKANDTDINQIARQTESICEAIDSPLLSIRIFTRKNSDVVPQIAPINILKSNTFAQKRDLHAPTKLPEIYKQLPAASGQSDSAQPLFSYAAVIKRNSENVTPSKNPVKPAVKEAKATKENEVAKVETPAKSKVSKKSILPIKPKVTETAGQFVGYYESMEKFLEQKKSIFSRFKTPTRLADCKEKFGSMVQGTGFQGIGFTYNNTTLLVSKVKNKFGEFIKIVEKSKDGLEKVTLVSKDNKVLKERIVRKAILINLLSRKTKYYSQNELNTTVGEKLNLLRDRISRFIANFDKFSAEYLAPKAEKRPYVRKGIMPVDGKINSEMSDKINSIGAWVEKSDISVTNATRIKKHGRARAFIFESGDKTITAAYIKNRFGIFLKIQEEIPQKEPNIYYINKEGKVVKNVDRARMVISNKPVFYNEEEIANSIQPELENILKELETKIQEHKQNATTPVKKAPPIKAVRENAPTQVDKLQARLNNANNLLQKINVLIKRLETELNQIQKKMK